MEVLGGNGYVEEGPMARIYRQMPLNSIWEGSGNVMCLDVLRAIAKHPRCLEALAAELAPALGRDRGSTRSPAELKDELRRPNTLEGLAAARQLTQAIAIADAGRAAGPLRAGFVADAFCASRLASARSRRGRSATLPAVHGPRGHRRPPAWPR